MTSFVYVAYGQEHVDMALKSIETVRKHHPGAHAYLYTDSKDYNFRVARPQLRVRPDYFEHPFMLTNVLCQTDFMLTSGKDIEPVVFLDNDVIMRQRLPQKLLDASVDMYVTWRDNVGKLSESQPYNYGVLIARCTVPAIRAMMWLEHRVSQLAPKYQKWYGNQIALRELAGPLKKNEVVTCNFPRFNVRIQQLPCHKWNWSPPMDNLKQNAGDKYFIHLKGDRKEAFDHYYNLVMNDGTT